MAPVVLRSIIRTLKGEGKSEVVPVLNKALRHEDVLG